MNINSKLLELCAPQRVSLIPLIVLPLFISACSVKTPDCADSKTQELVLESINQQVKEFLASDLGKGTISSAVSLVTALSGGKLEDSGRYDEIKYSLDNIVTTSKDEAIGKYTCKANVVSLLDENKTEAEIVFSSEMANNGEKHLVRTRISDEDFGAILSVSIFEKQD